MDQPGKVDRSLILQRGFPRFQQRCHQANAFAEQIADLFVCLLYHFGLATSVGAHQAKPALQAPTQTLCQTLVMPEIALGQFPLQLFR
ncbi:hypothetical protein D3C78_1697110 [compost metagenome]